MKPLAALFLVCSAALADASHLLLQNPTINGTHIVFSYADDLWTVARTGGDAVRLTSGPGIETEPHFSPDGSQVAFTGQYEGNIDVYVIAAQGGIPKRLTWHPDPDRVVGWTNDGKRVLFASARSSDTGMPKLYSVPVTGGPAEELSLNRAGYGTYSPSGTQLAYVPVTRFSFEAWKRYRGGRVTQIAIADLHDLSVSKVPSQGSNDSYPVWIGNIIFFLSDRNGRTTLFSYDTRTKKVEQVLAPGDLDIKWATGNDRTIVYERFGELRTYETATRKDQAVPVRVNADLPGIRPKFVSAAKHIESAGISPSGARAVFEARGEIITVPAEKGDARNLTSTVGVVERTPAWSPDGKLIAYWSDATGEYALHVINQNGLGDPKVIAMQEKGFYFEPQWSPDSQHLAFTDNKLQLWTVELATGKQTKIDTDTYYEPLGGQRMDPSWSPDSRWIAYTKKLRNHLRAALIYSLETGKSQQITEGMSDVESARFDRNGKYLYFTASTDVALSGHFLDMTSQLQQPTRSVYGVVLRKDLPSPLPLESDEEKAEQTQKQEPHPKALTPEDEKAAPATPAATGKTTESEKPADTAKEGETRIDFENIEHRIVSLPVTARNYEGLVPGKTGILYLIEAMPTPTGEPKSTIHKFDLKSRKTEKLVEDVKAFSVSSNGEKMLIGQGEKWTIAAAGAAPKPGEGVLNVASVQVRVDPKAEWKQMYSEVWRIERDWFYDLGYHGVNIEAMSSRYQPWLEQIGSRSDLNYLFQDMLGELTIGHLFVSGGDLPQPAPPITGLLGADYRIENGHFRFGRIYSGENWNPGTRAPLTQPGVDVKAGEYLFAVNGRAVAPDQDVYSYFEGTAGKQAVLRVGPDPNGSGARDVTVVPISSETQIRRLAWIESNRRKVDQLSNGRLAYVYLPNTGLQGYSYFNRYYFSQVGKEGAVIDERYNGGGQAADYIVNFLSRPLLNYWKTRYGDVFTTPRGAIFGPKAMIINETAGSGGDLLPWYFRRLKLGPLVGTRTWGGLVGILGYPNLMDGGRVTAPNLAFFSPEGAWEVENHGVAPDVEVDNDPKSAQEGRDPQLETAVRLVMTELSKTRRPEPKLPAYPNYQTNRNGRTPSSGGVQ